MTRAYFIYLVPVVSVLAGCSIFDPPLTTNNTSDSGMEVDSATNNDSGPTGDPNCEFSVKINELDGEGDQFIELFNSGVTSVNIGGFRIAEESAGGPSFGGAILIPDGYVLDAGRLVYAWVALPSSMARTGFQTTCIPGAPVPCLQASWSVRNTGETIFLIDRELNVTCKVTYPEIVPSRAWGRNPDGSAALQETQPTPGASNVAP